MNLLLSGLLLSAISIWSAVVVLPDRNLHVVVCDVGQGDGILVMQGTTQMLVDAGSGNKVLDCLARHMPFYDHQIEVAIITHPQSDHFGGFADVVDRYEVGQFLSDGFDNNTKSWKNLKNKIANIPYHTLSSGEIVKLSDQVTFNVVWPSQSYVAEVPREGLDLNVVAVVGRLNFKEFDMLLTADADSQIELAEMATGLLTPVDVLKVPHHGSKTGMLPEWLDYLSPQIAVISVGKNNSYGHPSQKALDLLTERNIKTLRTDQSGDVEIISDGQNWWYNTAK